MGWKTIRRRREELGYTAWLSVRKMSEVPSHGRKSLFTAIWMGRYWQQDQFRSSFAPPNGREISFGVVRLVDLRLNALYLVRKPTLKEKAPPRLGLQRSNQSFLLLRNSFGCQRVRKNYSETRLVANRTVETTRCQWGRLQVLRTRFVARLLAPRLPGSPDVSQACNLGERWRRNLLALSVPTGPRTHPLHRRQRDGNKCAR